ncbi:MAG: SEC-C domain-containing protein, partial [Acidobacteria bacterium]|nr:SEC-C domain-containing protein [Acidobacteriota bacterium]
VEQRCPEKAHPDTYELAELSQDIQNVFGVSVEHINLDGLDPQGIADEITEYLAKEYEAKERLVGSERLRYYERMVMLQILDTQWKDHLLSMDHLKEGIGLRGYGQKDPLIEYKKESFDIFEAMMQRFEEETLKILFNLQVAEGGQAPPARQATPTYEGPAKAEPEAEPASNGATSSAAMETSIEEFTRDVRRKKERELAQVSMAGSGGGAASTVKQVLTTAKVGRNDPCPCGSGKKYKKCCGQTA